MSEKTAVAKMIESAEVKGNNLKVSQAVYQEYWDSKGVTKDVFKALKEGVEEITVAGAKALEPIVVKTNEAATLDCGNNTFGVRVALGTIKEVNNPAKPGTKIDIAGPVQTKVKMHVSSTLFAEGSEIAAIQDHIRSKCSKK